MANTNIEKSGLRAGRKTAANAFTIDRLLVVSVPGYDPERDPDSFVLQIRLRRVVAMYLAARAKRGEVVL